MRRVKLLFRSRLFWFGLFGLMGLAGLWLNSSKHGYFVSWGEPGRGLFVSHGNGLVSAGMDNASTRSPGLGVGEATWLSPSDLRPWYPPIMMERVDFSSGHQIDQRTIRICYWLVLVVYGAVWIGALTWWLRRKARWLRLGEVGA
jgi:hypothetical protein